MPRLRHGDEAGGGSYIVTIVWGIIIGWMVANVTMVAWLIVGSWIRAGRPPFIAWMTNALGEEI